MPQARRQNATDARDPPPDEEEGQKAGRARLCGRNHAELHQNERAVANAFNNPVIEQLSH